MIYNKDSENETPKKVAINGAPKEQRKHDCNVKSVEHYFKAVLVNT
jgi:hypothetical protein